MRCYGSIIPGSESSTRFYLSTPIATSPTTVTSRPDSILRFKPVSRFSNASFKTKAAVQESISATADNLSFYDLLGIPESGTLLDIKQAYKQLARKYHPDVSPPDRVEEYTQRFIQVQEAYETLSDPRRRAIYDHDMARGLHLAFSARRRYRGDEEMEVKAEWKDRWESQLSGLKRRSMNKEAGGNMSWAARMRRQREQQMGNEI